MTRTYVHKTFSQEVRNYQTLLKEREKHLTLTIIDTHRDILIDAMLCYFHTLSKPSDILIQTKGATSSLARYVLYTLLREQGYTLAAIAYTLNRNPATIVQGIEHLQNFIIDNPNNPDYSNLHMQKNAEIPKPDLLRALTQLRTFNKEIHEFNLSEGKKGKRKDSRPFSSPEEKELSEFGL